MNTTKREIIKPWMIAAFVAIDVSLDAFSFQYEYIINLIFLFVIITVLIKFVEYFRAR